MTKPPFLALGLLLHGLPGVAVEPVEEASLRLFRDLAATRNFTLGMPVAATPTPDGSAVVFLRGGPRDPVLRLYELEVATGKVEELLTPEALLAGGEEQLSVAERARRERQRVSSRGFTGFELSQDGGQILLTLSGRLHVLRRTDRKLTSLPGEGWIDPHFSPDGRSVAAVRDREVHVLDVAGGSSLQLTQGATETLEHGLAEFVAQEEMDRFRGFWWSPDGDSIAYQETNLTAVETLYIADPAHPERPPEGFRYPRAGTANAVVRLGVIPRHGGATVWVQWDAERYPYLARVTWSAGAPLTLLVQDRVQREEKLLAVDVTSGATRELLSERDAAWLNLERDTKIPHWLDDGAGFLWSTERRGDWQLELRGRDGELRRELTPVGLHYDGVVGVDEASRTVLVKAGPDPRESHLYRVSLEGGEPARLSEGAGLHSGRLARAAPVYVHTYGLLDGRRGTVVRTLDGRLLAELPAVAEAPPFAPNLELTRVGEERVFDAALLRPRDFRAGEKYPVLLNVYAGPTSKMVQASAEKYFKGQWMADRGYIVVSLDGRGTPGHGRDWQRVVAGNLIDVALADQVEGLQLLGARYPELDMGRVGVTGWSFGGYFAAMATLRRPDVFHAGVAGAPVVDWADYDTFYTERYLDLPAVNPEGYRRSNVLTYAAELTRPLLVIHGLTDDNVYVVHSLKLAEALFQNGKHFELLPLTGTHMVSDALQTFRLWTRVMDFFDETLGVEAAAPGLH